MQLAKQLEDLFEQDKPRPIEYDRLKTHEVKAIKHKRRRNKTARNSRKKNRK